MQDNLITAMPTKQQVRDWLHTRWLMSRPLPDPEALRREVGWKRADPAPSSDMAPEKKRR